MTAQITMPYPLEQMLGYLDIDVGRSFEALPVRMEEAMMKCRSCEMYHTFGDSTACRYLLCPNRELIEDLERIQSVA